MLNRQEWNRRRSKLIGKLDDERASRELAKHKPNKVRQPISKAILEYELATGKKYSHIAEEYKIHPRKVSALAKLYGLDGKQ